MRSLAKCLPYPSLLLPPPQLSSHHTFTHPAGSIHSTPPTQPNHPSGPSGALWVPLGQGAVGVGGHWLAPCNELLGDSVWFHHSRNCSRGAPDPMKTNKSKYQELIQGLFAIAPPHPPPPPPHGRHIRVLPYLYIATNWLCVAALMRKPLKNMSEVFFPVPLHNKRAHPSVHLVVKRLHCSFDWTPNPPPPTKRSINLIFLNVLVISAASDAVLIQRWLILMLFFFNFFSFLKHQWIFCVVSCYI